MLRVLQALPAVAVLAAAQLLAPAASPSTLKTLHSFCAKKDCADGNSPSGALVRDPAGNLYGTSQLGTQSSAIYALIKTADGWKYRIAHAFCSETGCPDSGSSEKLISDALGNIYGVTRAGGAHGSGVVFELSPNGHRTRWKYRVLHSFCAKDACSDGAFPYGPLTYAGAADGAFYDGVSPLYGVTSGGGAGDHGVVFRLSPQGHRWNPDVLYRFCPQPDGEGHCPNGETPRGALHLDAAGALFGVTETGGLYDDNKMFGAGVVFELDPRAGRKARSETVLYRFCALEDCADGALPQGGVTADAQGRLLGTLHADGPHDGGAVFALTPDGRNSQYTVLHGFCEQPECMEGGRSAVPGLVVDNGGDVYGESYGGPHNGGGIYRLRGTRYKELYDFCTEAGCPDGQDPAGGLLLGADGHLYGVTYRGGDSGKGTVFELVP